MPEAHRTVRVMPVEGEPFAFRVESWTDPAHPHKVQLLHCRGVGECSCEFWQFTCWPNMQRNGFKAVPYETTGPNGDRLDTLCRHTTAARFHFLNHWLPELVANYPQYADQRGHDGAMGNRTG